MRYEPKKIIILGAIAGNAKKFDKIREISNIDPGELDTILGELEKDGMIRVEEKKGFLGKKIEITNTQKGTQELHDSVREAESKWGEMKAVYELKDKKKLQGFMDGNRSFFPMMMFFGVMDMMMFSMMFSMIGSSMSSYVPQESMPADDAGQDYGESGADDGGGFDFDLGF